MQPDCIVVVAYGKILPKEILEIPPHGCINVHASLLPKYRGAAPIQWAVLNGDPETGVTTMYMAEGLDTGDMLLKSRTEIGPEETSGELHDRLSQMGAELIVETLKEVEAGTVRRTPQGDAETSYASMLTKELGKIDWGRPAGELHNLVRGLSPWPVAETVYNKKRLKIHRAKVVPGFGGAPGEVARRKDCFEMCIRDSINIGFGNMVSANRLVAIVSPESAPIKRIIQDAKERGSLIDATYGRRTRAVIVTDSDHVILSAVQPETVANRLNDRDEDLEDEEELDEDD